MNGVDVALLVVLICLSIWVACELMQPFPEPDLEAIEAQKEYEHYDEPYDQEDEDEQPVQP